GKLPLPLAQLYRHAHNARTALQVYLASFYLWEAALKLLGCCAVVEYAHLGSPDADLAEQLRSLARPSLGQWCGLARSLPPALAERGDPQYRRMTDLMMGAARDDCPRAAGLDSLLRQWLDGKKGARSTVRLANLFDRLVNLRNEELGHGAAGQREAAYYE